MIGRVYRVSMGALQLKVEQKGVFDMGRHVDRVAASYNKGQKER